MKSLNSLPNAAEQTTHFKKQLFTANDFFNNPNLPDKISILAGDNPYADKDGLIEFICGVELLTDPVVTAKLMALKKILVSVTSVVADYVMRYAERYGAQFRTDPDLWALAISKVPLMGPTKLDKQGYSRHLEGVKIATDFLNLILDIVSGEGDALKTFKGFIEKQGEALRFGVDANTDYYSTFVAGIAVEVIKVGDQIAYIPKIKQYRIDFTRANTTWSAACISYEYVDIKFDYKYGVSVFDYEALEDAEIKSAFDDFINKSRKAQIESSDTFFNAEFPPKETTAKRELAGSMK